MKYTGFVVENYRAIRGRLEIDLDNQALVPLIGVNECGKTTILQAIFAFDYINDAEYAGRHLQNTLNLYDTSDSDPVVSSRVKTNHKNLKAIWEDYQQEAEGADEAAGLKPGLPITPQELGGELTISRNLRTKAYSIGNLASVPKGQQDGFARRIVRRLPYILYNDDFQDRPPSSVPIPTTRPQNLSGWPAIYERLFNATDANYSLFTTAAMDDSRRRGSIVSDVQATLNHTLSKAWKTFLLDQTKNIKVNLEIKPGKDGDSVLDISIVENLGQKERFFEVVDRSKGFLWFYNFVMKLEFNPKVVGSKSETIYLLDEPGSYLHAAAQEKLCTKLRAISRTHGKVIFCTHSHHLLNPNEIPLNSILIVGKSAKKRISVTPLPRYKTKGEKITALQPVLEALQVAGSDYVPDGKPVLVVEGIYDKYAIELFVPDAQKMRVLPGTSAASIQRNVQFLNAFSQEYVALWDNDAEGRRALAKAKLVFGPFESKRFDTLPSQEGGKDRRMEEMFVPADLRAISSALGLGDDSTYESIIGGLYYTSSNKKKRIRDAVGSETRRNFDILAKIIQKRLREGRLLAGK